MPRPESPAVPLRALALRLGPGEDLKAALDLFARRRGIEAGVVLTCVGSLERAVVRLANGRTTRTYRRHFEICSLVGTLSASGGSHLHVALADRTGAMVGGHLKEGSIVFTTAELAVGVLDGVGFEREPDPATGWRELVVRSAQRRGSNRKGGRSSPTPAGRGPKGPQ